MLAPKRLLNPSHSGLATPDDAHVAAAFPMKAVILSDDPDFALYATACLARVGRQARVNVQWTTKVWPINALNDSALKQSALEEASDAHLILLPESRAQSLPSCVFDWLRHWAVIRTVRDAAIGIVKDKPNLRNSVPASSTLAKLAQEHDLTIILDEEASAKNPVKLPIRIRSERMMALHVGHTRPLSL